MAVICQSVVIFLGAALPGQDNLVVALDTEHKVVAAVHPGSIGDLHGADGIAEIDHNGVWISIMVAEFMAVVLGTVFLAAKQKKYHY